MADDADTQKLTKSVDRSKKFLADVKDTLTRYLHNHKDAALPWLREIEQAEHKGKPSRVIIGVVGATGSGKSSIINAVLGEKQLVPTNCMRACTAVVTEISYNDRPDSDYRAVIEFVSRQEWQQELELLLGDIIADGKITADINDDESEAGIAFAKVQAVYPHLNKRNLLKANANQLLDYDYIKDMVDAEIEFCTPTAEKLHEKIQKYVDSKEKLTEDFEDHGLQASSSLDEIAYWPLIKTVRIYTKAAVLKAGSVLVDLPGIADSNAARAAIAQKYLQNCSALWIVAPIIRAVDDKSARSLIGEGFKRQLWRDGTIQRITFICSKTDEVSISEARSALQRYHEFREKFDQIDKDRTDATSNNKRLQESLVKVKEDIERVSQHQREAKQEESDYKKLQDRAKGAQPVYPLIQVETPKRKLDVQSSEVPSTPTKRTKFETHMTETFVSPNRRIPELSSSTTEMRQIEFREDATKPCLTTSQIKKKLENIKSIKSELKDKKKNLKEHEKNLKQDLAENRIGITEIRAREWIACVTGRNEVSSRAIRIDFAAGLRDIAKDENDEDELGENYGEEKVVQTGPDALPVFCVSAKGYYKAAGEMKDEKIAACFDKLEDTGVPGLRDHVYKLGNDKRIASLQIFTDGVERLSTSLKLWSSGDMIGNPTDEQVAGGTEEFCSQLVENFISGIFGIADSTMDTIASTIESEILSVLPGASKSASKAALVTSTKWVAPRKSDNPGLHWRTFRAVVRRTGSWSLRQKTIDFNVDLLHPYLRSVDTRWHDVFNVRIDNIFLKALRAGAAELDEFTKPFNARLSSGEDFEENTLCRMFDEQVKLFTKSLGTVFKDARASINEHQKEANRLFETSVKQQMQTIYKILEKESGNGMYERCKEKLKVYLDANKEVMFAKISKQVTKQLKAMLSEVRDTLLSDLKTSCDSLQRDCGYLCQKSRDFDTLPEEARNAIVEVLESANASAMWDAPGEDEPTIDSDILAGQYDMLDAADTNCTRSMPLRSLTPRFATPVTEDDCAGSDVEDSESSDEDSEVASSEDES